MSTRCRGLSPRGRGSLRPAQRRHQRQGSIPARAGEPGRGLSADHRHEVYPRAGGGAFLPGTMVGSHCGLSPRGRGSLRIGREAPDRLGSIPARAGEPSASRRATSACRVYPRAGGGAHAAQPVAQPGGGLSPRGRGSQDERSRSVRCRGSIPARAGEPVSWQCERCSGRVYPRAGGGARISKGGRPACAGLSPRGRGSPPPRPAGPPAPRSIPARAGEPLWPSAISEAHGVYPRAGGGAPRRCGPMGWITGLSPRGRGSPIQRLLNEGLIGSIPARAGEPLGAAPCWGLCRVYPRAGGGALRRRR